MYYVIQLISSFPEKFKGGPDNEQVPNFLFQLNR